MVLTSRGGWGVTEQTFSGSAAFPAREVCVLTRVMLKALRARDLPPKGSSFAFCNTAIRACQPQNVRPKNFAPRRSLYQPFVVASLLNAVYAIPPPVFHLQRL